VGKKCIYRVYCLSGKNKDDIFYVGITKLTLVEKLKFHINNGDVSNAEKCKKIRKYSKVLQIHELENVGFVEKKKALKRELYWMVKMKAAGFKLLNKHGLTGYIDPCRVAAKNPIIEKLQKEKQTT